MRKANKKNVSKYTHANGFIRNDKIFVCHTPTTCT